MFRRLIERNLLLDEKMWQIRLITKLNDKGKTSGEL